MNFFIVTTLLSQSFHTTVSSASIPFHSTTIFTLAYLLPLSLAHLPQQKTPFKLAILYNKSIAGAHPSFLLEEAILFCFVMVRYESILLISLFFFFDWHQGNTTIASVSVMQTKSGLGTHIITPTKYSTNNPCLDYGKYCIFWHINSILNADKTFEV